MSEKQPTNFIRVRAGESIHECIFNSRDWKILNYIEKKHQRYYSQVMAFHNNGFKISSEVGRNRLELLTAIKDLLNMIMEEVSFLEYDYSYFVPAHRDIEAGWNYGSRSGLRYNGNFLAIWVRSGQCLIEESRLGANGMGEVVKATDWRECKPLMLDAGVEIKFARRKKGLSWPIVFPPLIEFLESRQEETVYVLNKHR